MKPNELNTLFVCFLVHTQLSDYIFEKNQGEKNTLVSYYIFLSEDKIVMWVFSSM